MPKMTNSDLGRLLKSDEIQRVLREPKRTKVRRVTKKNPLKNMHAMFKLNPYATVLKRAAIKASMKKPIKPGVRIQI
jgi:large subunit ribosomal protein L4e